MKRKITIRNDFFSYFKYFFRILKDKFLISIFLSIGVSFLDGIGMAMFMPLIQSVSDDGQSVSFSSAALGKLHYFTDGLENMGINLNLYSILVVLIILFTLKGVFRFFQQYYQVKMCQFYMKTVQVDLTNHILNLSYEGFLTFDAGKIQNSLTTEVNRMRNGIMHYLTSFQSIIMLLTYMLLAYLANWKFALLVSLGAVISNVVFKRVFRLTKSASNSLSKKGNQFNSYILQAVHYFKYLKSTNYFSHYSKKLKTTIEETEFLNKKIGLYQSITSSVREPVLIIVVSLVILMQVTFFGSGLSTIMLSLLLFYRALIYLLSLQASWQSFIQNIGAFESVNSTLSHMKTLEEVNTGTKTFSFNHKIQLRNYAQGLSLLRMASQEHDWGLVLADIVPVWRAGCIIRAQFLNRIADAYAETPDLPVLLTAPYFTEAITRAQAPWRRVVIAAAEAGIPAPAFSSSLSYYDGIRADRLPAALVQGQRDFFGAHTYKRVDKPGTFHTLWSGDRTEIEAEDTH